LTPESIPSNVEIRSDDLSTTCFLPEINSLLFKIIMDSDEENNLYMSPPLTLIELDISVPFSTAKLMAHAINDPVNKSNATSPKLLEPQEV
jgi:hypothetical protein